MTFSIHDAVIDQKDKLLATRKEQLPERVQQQIFPQTVKLKQREKKWPFGHMEGPHFYFTDSIQVYSRN